METMDKVVTLKHKKVRKIGISVHGNKIKLWFHLFSTSEII